MEPLIEKLIEAQHVNLSDQEAADAINAMTVQVKQLALALKIKEWSYDEQLYSAIIEGCSSSDTQTRKLCINIRGWIDDPRVQNVDLDKTSAIATMNGLISTGIASSDQVDRLKALKWKTIKWTESVGLPELGVGLVQNARKMMGV